MWLKINNYFQNKKTKRIIKNIRAIGTNVIIKSPLTIVNPHKVTIGDNIHIGPNAWISCYTDVIISSGVIIGPNLRIYTGNHNYESNVAIPYDNITVAKKVIIQENVWIGGDVIIMPGVKLGEGCVVAGGSVVTKSFDSLSVIGGNPAKVIKRRDEATYYELKQKDRIYLKMKKDALLTPIVVEKD